MLPPPPLAAAACSRVLKEFLLRLRHSLATQRSHCRAINSVSRQCRLQTDEIVIMGATASSYTEAYVLGHREQAGDDLWPAQDAPAVVRRKNPVPCRPPEFRTTYLWLGHGRAEKRRVAAEKSAPDPAGDASAEGVGETAERGLASGVLGRVQVGALDAVEPFGDRFGELLGRIVHGHDPRGDVGLGAGMPTNSGRTVPAMERVPPVAVSFRGLRINRSRRHSLMSEFKVSDEDHRSPCCRCRDTYSASAHGRGRNRPDDG